VEGIRALSINEHLFYKLTYGSSTEGVKYRKEEAYVTRYLVTPTRHHLGRQTMEKSNDKVPQVKLSYLYSLDSVTKARYLEKLSIIDKTDPYTVEKRKWSQKRNEFPNILYPDI
jgi:hypothetical protein